ncbi:MAG: KH domain-containing protein [Alphaproteobacteria bacterium]|nr:KH domain-containing protein [Alphaproteobacteria bacterium]
MDGYRVANEVTRREAESEREAFHQRTERLDRLTEEGKFIDCSRISLAELENIKGDFKDDSELRLLWALGRYFMDEVQDFTKEGKMDILKKYLDIVNPSEHPYASSNLFPGYKTNSYSYDLEYCRYNDFLSNLNLKDNELKQIFERHPCANADLFIQYPTAYTKESAQQVVRLKMYNGWGQPLDEKFPEIKQTYLKHFGDDFDKIRFVDGKKVERSVPEGILQLLNTPFNLSYAQNIPEYIEKFLPQLMEIHSGETLIKYLVNETNKDTLGKILENKHQQDLEKVQQNIDTFFEQQGNRQYVLLDLSPFGIRRDYRDIYEKEGDYVYIMYIEDRKQDRSLLFNLKRIKESPEKRLTLYVPADIIGRVIGKSGSNIKKIEEVTGKKFQILAGDFRIAQKVQDAKDRITSHQEKAQTNPSQQGSNSPKFLGSKGPKGNDGR